MNCPLYIILQVTAVEIRQKDSVSRSATDVAKMEARITEKVSKKVTSDMGAKFNNFNDAFNINLVTAFANISKELSNQMEKKFDKLMAQNASKENVKDEIRTEAACQKMDCQPVASGVPVKSGAEDSVPKAKDKHARDPKESRMKWIQRNLKEIKNREEFDIFLGKACKLIREDAESKDLEIVRMTLDPNPSLSGRPCYFFQFNGSNILKCQHEFIHPSKPYRELFKMMEYSRKGFEIKLFMNVCQLCWLLRKAGVEHSLFNCEMVMELDLYEDDPHGTQMVSMRPKVAILENDSGAERHEYHSSEDEDGNRYLDKKIGIMDRLGPRLSDL